MENRLAPISVRIQLLGLDLTRNQTVTKWNHETLSFSRCRRRGVRADFSGGPISSNEGALLLREADRHLWMTEGVVRAVGDRRQCGKIRHDVVTMVREGVHTLALGYEEWFRRRASVAGRWRVGRRCAGSSSAPSASGRLRFISNWWSNSSLRWRTGPGN